MVTSLRLFAVPDMPFIQPGDDLAAIVVDRLAAAGERLEPGDVLVVAQKVVSKAEGRLVRLADVIASPQAHELAATVGKDPRIIQVVLDDSVAVLRVRRGLLVTEQRRRLGLRQRRRGPQQRAGRPGRATTWPSCRRTPTPAPRRLRSRLAELTGVAPVVIVNDSHGRAWRIGTVGVAIGCAGLPPVWNQRGLHDLFGYELVSSEECIADELAGAASLVMGQSDEGRPVVVVRGYRLPPGAAAPARSIQRAAETDAFR